MLVYTMEACVANKRIETIDQAANKGKAVFCTSTVKLNWGPRYVALLLYNFIY